MTTRTMPLTVEALFSALWKDYVGFNPFVLEIHKKFVDKEGGETTVVNDHIALRTFDDPRVDLDALARSFTRFDYVQKGDYNFPDKKLDAIHLENKKDPRLPKVFISHLRLTEFSHEFRAIVEKLLTQVPKDFSSRINFPYAGRPWQVSFSDYERLREESEYGAWVAAFGWRPNHFTVFVNALKKFKGIEEARDFLKKAGIPLNADGHIQGGQEVCLAQFSTRAGEVDVNFTEGPHHIPASYYEFAQRFPLPDGKLYQGFVEGSADKIFESTDRM